MQALFFLLHHLKAPAVSPYNDVGLICEIKAWKQRLGYFHAFISFQLVRNISRKFFSCFFGKNLFAYVKRQYNDAVFVTLVTDFTMTF